MLWQKAILFFWLFVTVARVWSVHANNVPSEFKESEAIYHQNKEQEKYTHEETLPVYSTSKEESSSTSPKGRKIVFDSSVGAPEGVYSDYQPNIQEGALEDMKNLQWVMVTREGYEYEGTFDEVKAMLAEDDEDASEDMDHMLSTIKDQSQNDVFDDVLPSTNHQSKVDVPANLGHTFNDETKADVFDDVLPSTNHQSKVNVPANLGHTFNDETKADVSDDVLLPSTNHQSKVDVPNLVHTLNNADVSDNVLPSTNHQSKVNVPANLGHTLNNADVSDDKNNNKADEHVSNDINDALSPMDHEDMPILPEYESFDRGFSENDPTSMNYDSEFDNPDDILERKRKSVIGIDTRDKVTSTEYPYSVIGRIDVGCTGTFVSSRSVLTAGHCVYNRRTKRWYSHLNIQRNKKCNPDSGETHYWKRAISVNGYTKHGQRSYDYGMIFYSNPTLAWSAYGYDSRFRRGQEIAINGYPGDKAGRCVWQSECMIKMALGRRVRYFCDTYGGMSGSGILAKGLKENVIYGIHTNGADRLCEYRRCNSGIRINRSIFKQIKKWVKNYN